MASKREYIEIAQVPKALIKGIRRSKLWKMHPRIGSSFHQVPGGEDGRKKGFSDR
jgi:hypothetical protein